MLTCLSQISEVLIYRLSQNIGSLHDGKMFATKSNVFLKKMFLAKKNEKDSVA